MSASTSYVVLRRDVEGGRWSEVATVDASNATTAIRHIAAKDAATAVYVAVPTRSWRPVTVKVETQTVLKLDARDST